MKGCSQLKSTKVGVFGILNVFSGNLSLHFYNQKISEDKLVLNKTLNKTWSLVPWELLTLGHWDLFPPPPPGLVWGEGGWRWGGGGGLVVGLVSDFR